MLACAFTVDMTDDELKEAIHRMYPVCQKQKTGFTLTISGYDFDPRDLWQIPEVIQFFQRLIDIGFAALLKLGGVDENDTMPGHPGFGILEIWMIATGRIKRGGNYETSREDYEAIMNLKAASIAKIEKILAEPCPNTGIQQHQMKIKKQDGTINEGSHRHRRDL